MHPSRHQNDRRKHPRFSPKGCTLAADLRVGVVIDVSRGGMSFYYADRKPWPKSEPQTGTLHCKAHDQLIHDIAMATVSDLKLPNISTAGTLALHRRSVCFGQLSSAQNEQLADLLALAAND